MSNISYYMDICGKLSTQLDQANKTIAEKDRFIAALQQTIDDLHLANSVLRADLELLKDSYWKARKIMGFENHGDETPAALTYLSLSELMISDATEMREDYQVAECMRLAMIFSAPPHSEGK